jgi:hypothetical protein
MFVLIPLLFMPFQEAPFPAEDSLLAEFPEEAKVERLLFNPNALAVAYLTEREKKYAFSLAGKPGREYDKIQGIVLSPDGRRYAYHARREGKWFLVVDGEEKAELYELKEAPSFWEFEYWLEAAVFSPDSRSFATRALKEKDKWAVAVDGKPGEEFDFVGRPTFSLDGTRVAYWANLGKGIDSTSGSYKIIEAPSGNTIGMGATVSWWSGAGKNFVSKAPSSFLLKDW